jgi:uncharacterized Tic20 family protein
MGGWLRFSSSRTPEDEMTVATDLDRELDEMAERELRGENAQTIPPPRSQSQGSPRFPRMDVLAPEGHVSQEDKNLAMITHGGTIAAAVFSGGFLDVAVPAIAYVLFKDKSDFLKDHVKHQLNFQLTALAVALVGAAFAAITFGIGLIVAVPAIVFFFLVDIYASIKAALAASRGEQYRFPFAIDFIK